LKYKIINLLLFIVLSTTTTFAIDKDDISLHGYGTLGVAYQDNKNVLYRNSVSSKRGTRGDLSFDNYSTFGLQSDIKISDKLSVNVQGIFTRNSNKSLELSWLNTKYQLNDDSSIRIGKMRLPAFMYSDILNVSYSYDWIRLPDMYSIVPLKGYTALEFSQNLEFENLSVMATASYGQAKNSLYQSSDKGLIEKSKAKLKDIYSINLKILHDNFTFRIAYLQFLATLSNNSLDSAFRNLNSLNIPVISQAVDQYKIEDARVKYFEIGAKYDFEKAYLVGEYLKYYNDSILSNNTSWYIGTGYNFENWSPFILYSNIDSTQNYKAIKKKEGRSREVLTAIDNANQVFSTLSARNIKLETISLGFRYNLSENSILKLQYDRQHEKKKNRLNFHYSNDKEVNLDIFSASVNFVF